MNGVGAIDEKGLLAEIMRSDKRVALLEQTAEFCKQYSMPGAEVNGQKVQSLFSEIAYLPPQMRLLHKKHLIEAGVMSEDDFKITMLSLNPTREISDWTFPATGNGNGGVKSILPPILRLKMESVSQLLEEPEPKLEWFIENLWVASSRGFIAGNPGVGKTWLALDMLISCVTGLPCLGRYPVADKGPCLLVEEEASRLNLARRVHALAKGRGLSYSDLQGFDHITRNFSKILKDEKELIALIQDNGHKVVAFDSLRRFHDCKENSSDEMQPVLDAFARINAETGASIILIHHLAKSGGDHGGSKSVFERMRGTSDLWAWRDCIVGLEGEEEADTAAGYFQFRDAEATPPITIKRVVDPMTGAITLEALDQGESAEYQEKIEAITGYMRIQYGPVSMENILENVKGKRQKMIQAFKYMERVGLVEKVPEGIRHKWRLK